MIPLPSKKVAPTLVACVITVAAIAIVYTYTPRSVKNSNEKAQISAEATSTIPDYATSIDSDNDGLKDWEEALWGADPKKTDTDGDKTSDGEEIKLSRNPTVKGPGDSLDKKPAKNSKTAEIAPENDTTIDKFSRDLFARYVDLKRSGMLTEEMQIALIQDLLNSSDYSKPVTYKKYSATDFKINGAAGAEGLRTYGNIMGSIVKKDMPLDGDGELAILERYLSNQDKNELVKLQKIANGYKQMVSDLLRVPVPQNVFPYHSALTNIISQRVKILEVILLVDQDSLRALGGVTQYRDNVGVLTVAFTQFNVFFQINKVVFAQDEDGYLFTHII